MWFGEPSECQEINSKLVLQVQQPNNASVEMRASAAGGHWHLGHLALRGRYTFNDKYPR